MDQAQHVHVQRKEGVPVSNEKARPAVQAMPRNAKGTLIVTRERRQRLVEIAWGVGIALSLVFTPVILAAIERAIS